MAARRLLVVLGVLFLACLCCAEDPAGVACPPPEGKNLSCVCQHPDGIIDLTPLANINGTARFTDIQGPDFKYDYNPCYPFTSKMACVNVHMCQIIDNIYYEMDNATEHIYIDEKEGTYVYYATRWEQTIYTLRTFVKLICDKSLPTGHAQVTTTGDSDPPLHYRFTLKSCHSCPGGCK